jgi:uncharacterized membrane protein YqaE (UPF0057 family)
MKNTIKFLAICIIGSFLLNSCSTSNDVVSGGIMSKRKYNKGFHFNNNPRSLDLSKVKTKGNFRIKEQGNTDFIIEENQIAKTNDESSVFNKNEVLVVSTSGKNMEDNKVLVRETSITKSINLTSFEKQTKLNTIYKQETVLKTKQKDYKEKKGRGDTDTLLLIILCFLIPPLAVFLFEGSWTSRCTLNLILTLLCGIPGVIHALIVILG